MKSTICLIILIALSTSSCGKKSIVDSSGIKIKSSLTNQEVSALEKAIVDDKTCIEKKLSQDLESENSTKKLIANTDFIFCNGTRIRLKAYQFSSKKIKTYGFINDNSGIETCLSGSDLKRTFLLGLQGTIQANKVKITLGGNQLNTDGSIIPSEKILARHVRFSGESFKGEIGIIKENKSICSEIVE